MPHMEPGFLTDCALSVPTEPRDRVAGHRRARAAAGAAGDPVPIPGITRRAVERIDRRAAECPFVEIGFAENDRAGFFELGDDRGVKVRFPVVQNLRTGCGSDAFRRNVSLMEKGMPWSGPR